MSDVPNNGAFYIKAEDVTADDNFTVPGDRTGYSPEDSKNPSQPSYSIANRQTKYRKEYNVHVYNGWDTAVQARIRGSSYDDREMTKSVIEQAETVIGKDNSIVFEDLTSHNFLEVEIIKILSIPTTGTLEVVIQDRV